MTINFSKYEGAGNDFILIDDRKQSFPENDSNLINHLCHRHLGIGADGLVLLREKQGVDFQMVYFNSDGRESSMCGNGARCITLFVNNLGLIKDKYTFTAIDGEHESILLSQNNAAVKMSEVMEVETGQDYYLMNTGSPHYVIFKDDLNNLDIISEARKIRYSERFKTEGVNVNFVSSTKNENTMRTYERGVEDETLACGTGTVAVAIAIAEKNNYSMPHQQYFINSPGGKLKVTFDRNGKDLFTNVWLEGPVNKVFSGVYEMDLK
jgi:diaminopimelate epimerase